MKAISSFFRIIAGMLMIFFVIAFPISLLGRGVGQILFSPGGFVQGVAESLLDADIFASVAEELFSDLELQIENSSVEDAFIIGMMANLNHDDWVEVIQTIAPGELMKQTTQEFFGGFYDWLNGPDPYPHIEIDLRDWKYNIQTSTIPVLEIVLAALPNCSTSEIENFVLEDIPFCKPIEPYYSQFIDAASSDISIRLSELPDVYSLGAQGDATASESLLQAKQVLRGIRNFLRLSWLFAFVVFLVAIPMGARSLPGVFMWTGWPLVISAAFTLLLSLLIIVLGGGAVAGLAQGLTAGLPTAFDSPLKAAISGVISITGSALLIQAILQFFIGGAALVVGFAWSRSRKSQQSNIPKIVEPEVPNDSIHPTAAEILNESAEDDDSKPTGMFG
ncbi:MAG: hypothetical protein IH859_01340 [Chloroflexi bacterium]|nr:hypothetical protein [Chloroflexota bacterium]